MLLKLTPVVHEQTVLATPLGDYILQFHERLEVRAVFRSKVHPEKSEVYLAVLGFFEETDCWAVWTYLPSEYGYRIKLVWMSNEKGAGSVANQLSVTRAFYRALEVSMGTRWTKRHHPFDVRSDANTVFDMFDTACEEFRLAVKAWTVNSTFTGR